MSINSPSGAENSILITYGKSGEAPTISPMGLVDDDVNLILSSKGQGAVSTASGVSFGIGVSNPQISLAIGNNDNGLNQVGNDLALYTSNTERIRFDTSGNVGIGTTSPTRKLEVNGRILAKTSLLIGDSTDTASDRLISALDSDMSGSRYITFGQSNTTGNQAELSFYYDGDNSSSNRFSLGFHSSANILNIVRTGSVGIGTASPGRKLHVYDSQNPQLKLQGTGTWDLAAESGGFVFYHPYGSVYYKINNDNSISVNSDDRLKVNEQYITNAVDTIMKLKPQTFNMVIDGTPLERKTPGLIAQDVYYDCPELRFLVDVPPDAVPGDKPSTPDDPTQDPDYSNWGSTYAGINYSGFLAYLIKAVQEQQTTINELKARIEVLETS